MFIGDLGESNFGALGTMLRGGVRLPMFDVTVATEYWPNMESFRIVSAQVEGTFYLSRAAAAPVLVMGVGHSWSHYTGLYGGGGSNGASASVGIGMHIPVSRLYALRPEALIRTDGGGWNGSLRLLFAYAPSLQVEPRDLSGPSGGVSTFWMIPIGGPWHLRAPGAAIHYSRPVSLRYDVGLDVALVHWYMPGPASGYVADTRSFIAMPSVQRALDDRGFLSVRGGPAVVIMGEGPDNGANLGLDAMLVLSGRPIGGPLSAGVGWLWFPRDDPGYGGDQHGLLLSLAFQF